MQLASGSHIPDGLLAANALLSEKLHQGFAAPKSTLHQGFSVSISSTPLGIIGPLYDAGTGSRYTGKERDTESGNDYFGARYYASSMGRFMSPDWAEKAMPVPYASLENPQSLNLYSYVGNNPLSGTDADGHCSAPSVQGGHVGICLESYIQMARFGFLNLGHGDNRGPVGNDPSATYRTQTMIDVNIGAQSATEHSTAGLSVTDIRSKQGVVHDWISDTKKGADGSTTFTVHVYGENGEEAAGNPLAPGGWIEMTFTLKVAANGTVSVVNDSTKQFPSISI
jgi:RHS repeat-associated protein